jgi:hypothetical protein
MALREEHYLLDNGDSELITLGTRKNMYPIVVFYV